MLNKVLLIGRLTGDPVITYLPSGTPVVEFTIAYNRRFKNQNGEFQEESHFFDVKAYGKFAEDWATRFSKGYLVLVEGRLAQERWEKEGKKYSKVKIIAENVKLISRPKGAETHEEEEEVPPIEEEIEKLSKEEEKPFTDEEDEIPF